MAMVTVQPDEKTLSYYQHQLFTGERYLVCGALHDTRTSLASSPENKLYCSPPFHRVVLVTYDFSIKTSLGSNYRVAWRNDHVTVYVPFQKKNWHLIRYDLIQNYTYFCDLIVIILSPFMMSIRRVRPISRLNYTQSGLKSGNIFPIFFQPVFKNFVSRQARSTRTPNSNG